MPATNLTNLTQDLLTETGEYRYFSVEDQPVQVQASSPVTDGLSPAVADGAGLPMTMQEFSEAVSEAVGSEGAVDFPALPPLSPAENPCPGAPIKSGQSSRRGGLDPRTLFN